MPSGSLALLGSGEYLPSMQVLEAMLIEDGIRSGKRPVFVQLATAAGRESDERIAYWRDLGAEQGRRLGVAVAFVHVFNRERALDPTHLAVVEGAALTYFSGGDPHHLADTMRGTPLWEAIAANHRSGGSLAGCSAGAMFLSRRVPSLRFLHRQPIEGMDVVPHLQVIPHFNMIHRWIPDAAVRLMTTIPEGVTLAGIDDETALLRRDGAWSVWGHGSVHLLTGEVTGVIPAGQGIPSLVE
jgi:cyanophycinase-like exopeptidase